MLEVYRGDAANSVADGGDKWDLGVFGTPLGKQDMSDIVARPRWTDKVSVAIATLAMITSAATFYTSTLRQIDNLSLIPAQIPVASFSGAEELSVEGGGKTPISLAFINSGTRPVAILYVSVKIDQHVGYSTDVPCGDTATYFHTDFEPLIVRQDQIIIRDFRLNDVAMKDTVRKGPDGTFLVPLSKQNKHQSEIKYAVCFEFYVATPSRTNMWKDVLAGEYLIKRGQGGAEELPGTDQGKPRNIIKDSRSIFRIFWPWNEI